MNKSVSYILRLVVTLFAITAVVAGLLAGVNLLTRDRIADAKAQKTLDAIAEVLPDGGQAQQLEQYEDKTGLVTAVYSSPQGYAVKVTPNGFGGAIEMMVGVSKEGKVLGISIISHAETPSLGAVAAADSAKGQAFRDSFIGFDGSDPEDYDAISGATITSKAVAEGVAAAVACVKEGL